MSHRTFAVKISSAPEGKLGLSVIGSPAGEASDIVDKMVDPGDLERLRRSLSKSRHVGSGERPSAPRPQSRAEVRALLEAVGEDLFNSLIPEGIRPVWQESKGWAASNRERLRIEIHIDPRDEVLRPAVSLPWELTFQASTGSFLGLDPTNSIVRYLDLERAARGVQFDQTIRVLVADARPRGVSMLDLDEEKKRLIAVLEEAEGVEVTHLEGATAARLRRSLVREKPHVLHFMGHGFSDPSSGWGGLVLETEGGEADELGGHDLRDLFQGDSDLSLVVLNACDTARPGSVDQPFAGAAAGLAHAGIPAVVAMQFPISDRAAIVFSEAFYETLASGAGVGEAVVEGRMAIHLTDRESLEWITPVLFMRGGEQRAQPGVRPADTKDRKPLEPGPSTPRPQAGGDVHQVVTIEGDSGKTVSIGKARDVKFGSF